jgi:two-component system, NarL family, nitrate/nitrite response regulator NarL
MRSSGRFAATRKGVAETIRDGGVGLAGVSRGGAASPARIVLVDHHRKVLAGLRELIDRDSDLVVVAACCCVDGAIAAVQQYRPQVVILDVRLPDRDGFELIRDIAAISEARIIVFTAILRKAKVLSALHSGAKAVVFKNQPASVLISCIRARASESRGLE